MKFHSENKGKNMRKIITFLSIVAVLLFSTFCKANVLPLSTNEIPTNSIGLYQIDKRITIYNKPNGNSSLIIDKEINYSDFLNSKTDNLFAIILPKKEIAYLYVTDISEDENWLEVITDKTSLKKGWVYKNDEFQFMPWISFVNLYGKKYGLIELKNSSHNANIYSQPDENSQILGKLNRPQYIRLTSVEGIWALSSVLDLSRETTTGYIQWRNEKGLIYLFPNIK